MYAIIVTGGKQYKVEEGASIYVEKLDAKEGDKDRKSTRLNSSH